MAYLAKLTKRISAGRTHRLVAVIIGLAACSSGGDSPTTPASTTAVVDTRVASVLVTPTSVSGNLGETGQFTATALNAAGGSIHSQAITWTSADPTIANVNASGYVAAVGVGSTTVTAMANGVSSQSLVTVAGEPVAAVVISPSSMNGFIGQTTQFRATLMNDAGNTLNGRPVIWSSDNTSVVVVDSTGKATQIGLGTASVSATSAGRKGSGSLIVSAAVAPVPAPGTVADLSVTATTDTSATLSFSQVNDGTGSPANYLVRYAVGPITWSSATPATTGTCAPQVIGNTAGTAVSCTVMGLDASTSYSFQVLPYRGTLGTDAVFGSVSNAGTSSTSEPTTAQAGVASVSINPPSPATTAGQTVQFAAAAKNTGGKTLSGRSFSWASSNANVASISANGLATTQAAGSTTITVTSEGKSAQAVLTVTTAVSPPVAPAQITVASVSVTPGTSSLLVGATQQFAAVVLDAGGNPLAGQPIAWTSSNTAVATVSSGGLLSAVAAGSVTVTATSAGKNGTATATVTAPAPPPPAPPSGPATVATVSVAPVSVALVVGQTHPLTPTVLDGSGNTMTGQTVVWSSSNTAIVTVSTSGLATAVGAGSATISATAGGKSGTSNFTITAPAPPPTVATVSVAPGSASATVGATQQFTATARDAQGNVMAGQSVTWSTSNPAIATVSAGGLATAVSAGSATLTATVSGKTGTASLTVTAAAIPAPGTVSDLAVLATTDTSATLSFSQVNDGTGQPANYDIRFALAPIGFGWGSATSVARGTCTSPMVGTGISGTRTCTVFGLVASKAYNFQMVVYRITLGVSVFGGLSNVAAGTTAAAGGALPGAPATVTVGPATASVVAGATQQLTATVKDAQGAVLSGQTIAWTTSSAAIATVSGGGLVSAVSAGTATITATSGGKSGTAAITVTAVPPPAVASVTLTPSAPTLSVGSSQLLTATVKDAGGNVLSSATVAWSTSNAAVASQSLGGVITAVSAGTATITASSGGKSGTALVTVSGGGSPPPPSTGDPSPPAGAEMIVDTRAGGAQSWQGQGGAITNTADALNRLKANGSGVIGYEDRYPWNAAWVPDFGGGVSVLRSQVPGWNGVPADGGGAAWIVYFSRFKYRHYFIQWKVWMGRTDAGGGLGQNGVFTINNQGEPDAHPGRKMMLVSNEAQSGQVYAPVGSFTRMDILWGGVTLANNAVAFNPIITDWVTTGFTTGNSYGVLPGVSYSTPANGVWHTLTYEFKGTSSELASDGEYRHWFDGQKKIEVTGRPLGNYTLTALQFPAVIRSPAQDQTEYYKDFVVWVSP